MNKLKIFKIIHQIGFVCLFVALVFSFVNSFCPTPIFKSWIILPLLVVGIVGIVTGFIYISKLPDDKDESADSSTDTKTEE